MGKKIWFLIAYYFGLAVIIYRITSAILGEALFEAFIFMIALVFWVITLALIYILEETKDERP